MVSYTVLTKRMSVLKVIERIHLDELVRETGINANPEWFGAEALREFIRIRWDDVEDMDERILRLIRNMITSKQEGK